MALVAVITADIVNSTLVSPATAKKMMEKLVLLLKDYPHEFYRGDSLQILVPQPANALTLLMQLRTEVRKLSALLDVRAAIGIGEAGASVKNLRMASGEAFILSGRSFDLLAEKNDKLVIRTGSNVVNYGLSAVASFADYIFKYVTEKQAGVLAELLKGSSQLEITRKLKKSPSTISQHAQAAGWTTLSRVLEDYKNLISVIGK